MLTIASLVTMIRSETQDANYRTVARGDVLASFIYKKKDRLLEVVAFGGVNAVAAGSSNDGLEPNRAIMGSIC